MIKETLTRDEKVNKIKHKAELEATNEIKHYKQLLCQLMQTYDASCNEEAIDLTISKIFVLNSLLHWIKSDRFCKEVYHNGDFVLRDRKLDIILNESFNFVRSYMVSLQTDSKEIHDNITIVGLTFTDKYISQSVISVFDEILFDKENNND